MPVDRGLGRADAEVLEAHVPALPQVDEVAEPGELPSDTEAESVDAAVAADPATDSEQGSEFESESEAFVAREALTLADLADRQGSWLLNTVSCSKKRACSPFPCSCVVG